MSLNGTKESSERGISPTNVPFTTLLNLPLGIGASSLLSPSPHMLTPPASADRPNSINGLDSSRTPTSTTPVQHPLSVRTPQHMTVSSSTLLHSPTFSSGAEENRHNRQTNYEYEGTLNYLGILTSLLRRQQQQQQESSARAPHTVGGSVRSLWPSSGLEDEGSSISLSPFMSSSIVSQDLRAQLLMASANSFQELPKTPRQELQKSPRGINSSFGGSTASITSSTDNASRSSGLVTSASEVEVLSRTGVFSASTKTPSSETQTSSGNLLAASATLLSSVGHLPLSPQSERPQNVNSNPLVIPIGHRVNNDHQSVTPYPWPSTTPQTFMNPVAISPVDLPTSKTESSTRSNSAKKVPLELESIFLPSRMPSFNSMAQPKKYSRTLCYHSTNISDGSLDTFNEEKIDVCSVKDSLLLKVVEHHQPGEHRERDPADSEDDVQDSGDKETTSSPKLFSQLGSQCSRTVPSLMKFFSRHKRSLASSLSINLAVSGQATPPCSPISPGTLTIVPPITQRLSLEVSTMTSPTDRSSVERSSTASLISPSGGSEGSTDGITPTRKSSVGAAVDARLVEPSSTLALTVLTVPTIAPSITTADSKVSRTAPNKATTKKQKSIEKNLSASGNVEVTRPVSMSVPVPVTSSVGSVPSGMTYPSPWPITHNPLPHPGHFWMPPGVETGVGAAGLGLGYHVARDQLTGQLFLLPRPHPLSDPSGHGLMWTGYGSMPAPPVMMTPQQLLLSDPHFRHHLHPSLMHVHHSSAVHPSRPSSKNDESPSCTPKDEAKKAPTPIVGTESPSNEIPLPTPVPPPPFLFPPTTLPYFFPHQSPHPNHYALSPFPHASTPALGMPTSLIQSVSNITSATPTLTMTTATVLDPATVTSSLSNIKAAASSSVWSRSSDKPIPSPGLHKPLVCPPTSDSYYSDPPMDLRQRRSRSPLCQNEALATNASTSSPSVSSLGSSVSHQISKSGAISEKLLRTKPIRIKKEIKEEVLSPPLGLTAEEETAKPHEGKAPPCIKIENTRACSENNVETPCVVEQELNFCRKSFDSLTFSNRNSPLSSPDVPVDKLKNFSEKDVCGKTPNSKSEIDSSGLELLLQTVLQHGERLAPSPVKDFDSCSSHSDQMPHLERAAKTPSPGCSPASFESLPPVLTPLTPIPMMLPGSESSSPEPTPPPLDMYLDEPVRVMEPLLSTLEQPKPPSCFSILCALAEQRIMEEQQTSCSALSSLAEVASSTPSVPTDIPLCQSNSPLTETDEDEENISKHFQELTVQVSESVPSTSFAESILGDENDCESREPTRIIDINRNYKSPESEREVKAFIANKVSQYQKETNGESHSVPTYQIDDMDATEIDMRMKLADIQRQYREKQRELSRLLPRKELISPLKRGRGRPPKPKTSNIIQGIKKKVGRPLKRLQDSCVLAVKETTDQEPLEDDKRNDEKPSEDGRVSLNSINSELIADPSLVPSHPDTNNTPVANSGETKENKQEEISERDVVLTTSTEAFRPPLSQLQDIKHDDSDDDERSEGSVSKRDPLLLNTETSVESSTSDAELHTSSSSKKRKPGRPKKHSPTKYDGTETIVAKKPKSLGFLLLSQKSRIRPKLKAELKRRDSDEDDDDESELHHSTNHSAISEDLSEEKSYAKMTIPPTSQMKTNCIKPAKMSCKVQRQGALRGRASLSRNTILRDKEKRKTAFEQNSQMQELFRSLKRHSKVADPEHDESGDERENDKNVEEKPEHQSIVENGFNAPEPASELENKALSVSDQSSNQSPEVKETIAVKTEPKDVVDTSSGSFLTEHPVESAQQVQDNQKDVIVKIEPVSDEDASKQTAARIDDGERVKAKGVCTLLMEDLVSGARVLILQDGLLYAGTLNPITPPDVYGVHVDGERGTRPHICCQEELLNQAWKEVKPGSTRFLTEGTRVCAFWSQQYRGLYPAYHLGGKPSQLEPLQQQAAGCVAAASSPTHEGNHNLVNVEFDDGDSGRIHVDDIRLLPQDFPVIDFDPNPLMTLNKRKRRPTGEDGVGDKISETPIKKPRVDGSPSASTSKNRTVEKGSKPQKKLKEMEIKVKIGKNKIVSALEDDTISNNNNNINNNNDVSNENNNSPSSKAVASECENRSDDDDRETSAVKKDGSLRSEKKHKRRHHTETHKHRHKHKKKNKGGTDRPLLRVEPGDGELRMRIKSPPPIAQESDEPSSSEDDKTSDEDDGDEWNQASEAKTTKQPKRRQKRSPSEKSRIAPFLLERQLWRWAGKGYRRPGSKGKGKKEFHKEIVRGKEHIRVGDCAVFLSSGSPERPFIGKIDFLWEAWGGNMVVKVSWFYHPDETKGGTKKLAEPKGALFSSSHTDENDVQTISHKCDVISLAEYKVRRADIERKKGPHYENYNLYYLAGFYDTTYGRITMEPGVS